MIFQGGLRHQNTTCCKTMILQDRLAPKSSCFHTLLSSSAYPCSFPQASATELQTPIIPKTTPTTMSDMTSQTSHCGPSLISFRMASRNMKAGKIKQTRVTVVPPPTLFMRPRSVMKHEAIVMIDKRKRVKTFNFTAVSTSLVIPRISRQLSRTPMKLRG